MVIELLNSSLEDCFAICDSKLSVKTTSMLAIQMIERMQLLHSMGFVHRDLKPDNFMFSGSKLHKEIYMIDFGLAKRWNDRKTLEHIPFRDGKPMAGTARFASINTHLGIQ